MDTTTLTNMLASYAEKAAEAISSLASTYGQEAINLALLYVRLDIVAKSGWNLMWATFAVVMFLVIASMHKRLRAWIRDKHDGEWDTGPETALPTVGCYLIKGLAIFMITINLLDAVHPWRIIGIIKPEVYMIHKAVQAATEKTTAKK